MTVSDLKKIIVQSNLDSGPNWQHAPTVHEVVQYEGKSYKVRAYLNDELAKRQKELLDKVPQRFIKCHGRINRYLVFDFVEEAFGDPEEKLAALGDFLAELTTVKIDDSNRSDFDSWCEDLWEAKIFTSKTISLLRRYYLEAQSMACRWQLEYFDAMPANFVLQANGLLAVDEKHLRVGPEGISLIKPNSKLSSVEFQRVLDTYWLKTNFDRFSDPKYREFLLFYYFVYGLAVVGTYKPRKVNAGIRDFHVRRRGLLQIVNAPRSLCFKEESWWSLRYRLSRILRFIGRTIGYIRRRSFVIEKQETISN